MLLSTWPHSVAEARKEKKILSAAQPGLLRLGMEL